MSARTLWSWASVGILAGCVLPHHDDGFRARLAAGCASKEACAALEGEASRRYAECQRRGARWQDCQDLAEDRSAARRLQTEQEHREEGQRHARVQERHASIAAVSAERTRLDGVAGRLKGTCEDAALVDATIAQVPGDVPQAERDEIVARFREKARKRRDEHLQQIKGRIESAMRRRVNLTEAADPESARAPVQEVQRLVAEAACPNEGRLDLLAELAGRVEAWAAATEKGIQEEKACRATPSCIGGRVAKPLCEAIQRRKDLAADIARERANPAGVVNLTYLNQLGREVQDTDDEIANLKKDYASAAKKPFSESVCPRGS